MKKLFVTSLIGILAFAPLIHAGDQKFETNTFYMDKVTAKPGDQIALKTYLANVDTLAGCQIAIFFRHENINLWCDSVSFEGSRMDYFTPLVVKLPQTEKDDKVIFYSLINTYDPDLYIDPLPPGDGLLATIYFTVPKDSPEGTVKLERGMIPHPHLSFIFSVWNPYGDEVDGEFRPSEIVIKK